MSKLGFHVSIGKRTGFREALQRAADAGNPVACVFSLEQDLWPDIHTASPNTTYIFRTQVNGDGPQDAYRGDPLESARAFMAPVWGKWLVNHAHYHAPLNEFDPKSIDDLRWYNAFACEVIKMSNERGYAIALPAFSSGNPPDSPFTRYEAWTELLPMLEAIDAGGHLLILHEYGLQFETLEISRAYLALRYRSLLRFMAQRGLAAQLVISEASAGAGYDGQSVSWLLDAKWYDGQLMQDRAVIGACLYQIGGAESFVAILPTLADYIARTPTPALESQADPCVVGPDTNAAGVPVPESVPPDILPPPPAGCRGAPRTQYARIVNVVVDPEAAKEVLRLTWPQTVSNSYDDAGIGDLDDRSAVLWNIAPDQQDRFDEWYRVNYPGVKVTFRETGSTPPPPGGKAWRGLHLRADGHSNTSDFEALKVARCTAAKIMTNTDFEELSSLIANGIAPERIVLRLYAAGDNPALKDAKLFYSEQRAWIAEFAQRGGRYIEVHNEPNLPQEGLGFAWQNAIGFSAWYEDVARQIRTNHPQVLIGWPGLSPQPNEPEFTAELKEEIEAGWVDWIGAHAYWINAAGMESPSDGRYYRRWLGLGKPILITEFSNKGLTDSDAVKGSQYQAYYASLENGVLGAYAFVSSASAQAFDATRETWVRSGSLTDIPKAVGA